MTIRDAARALGTTERGVRLRLHALRPEIAPMLRRGRNGAVILTDPAWALLRRLEDVRQASALTVNLAAERVRRELAERVTGEGQPTPTHGNGDGELVAELRQQIARLESEVAFLRQLVNERLPALPPPRRSWLHRLVFGA